MAERKLIYFVADVHLGLKLKDPEEREKRFIAFLKGLPAESMRALYLLGDIWDFWYEYRDVVPRFGARVVAEYIRLMDAGVEVWFCPGNHDIWTYSYFEELGMKRFDQPYYVTIDGKDFCLGHGDLLGGAPRGYAFMLNVFRCRRSTPGWPTVSGCPGPIPAAASTKDTSSPASRRRSTASRSKLRSSGTSTTSSSGTTTCTRT